MDVFYLYRDQVFVWDGRKASENAKKHQVIFEDACEAFFDDLSAYVDASTDDEVRNAVIGMSGSSGLLFVVHIERANQQLRIISARVASAQERKEYENS